MGRPAVRLCPPWAFPLPSPHLSAAFHFTFGCFLLTDPMPFTGRSAAFPWPSTAFPSPAAASPQPSLDTPTVSSLPAGGGAEEEGLSQGEIEEWLDMMSKKIS